MKPIHVSAPGKIILLGEHAVVYDQPAIAVPLSAINVTVSAQSAPPGSGLTVQAPTVEQTLSITARPEETLFYDALIYPLRITLDVLRIPPPNLMLTVTSSIPIASGLGSGAALATALIRALCVAIEHPLDNNTLNPLVFAVEQQHHITPSGIDNTVIVYNQPVYFVRGMPPVPFTIAQPFTLLVADTGHSSPTHRTVNAVRELYAAEPKRIGAIFTRIGEITQSAYAAITSGDNHLLGSLMNENHTLLSDLTVSSAKLDRLCATARDAGALGAKLSGGGRGGNIIALANPDHAHVISKALQAAGAANVIQTTVEQPP